MDAVGGEMNAFTTKEYTCYYARVLDADLPLAIDVLTDMVTASLIEPKDVDAERGVVLEEIAMNEDDPSDSVYEAFTGRLFGDTPLGRPVLGTVDSINAITRDQIFEHYRARYTPPSLVVAAAGNLDHDTVVGYVQAAFGSVLGDFGGAVPAGPRLRDAGGLWDGYGSAAGSGATLISRPIEQANLVLGCEGLARTDDRRFALSVLNAALGGGMSSRLFQEVREKRGLAYSVYSFASQHADTGLWGIYAGCLPSKTDEVLSICTAEVAKVVESGLTDAELDRGKGQVRGGIVLGPGGPVLADDPPGQVRAGLPATWSRWTTCSPRSTRSATTTSARSRPRSSPGPRSWRSSARSRTRPPSSAPWGSRAGALHPRQAAAARQLAPPPAAPERAAVNLGRCRARP